MTEQLVLLREMSRSEEIAQYREGSDRHWTTSVYPPHARKVGATLFMLAIVLLWEFSDISLLVTQVSLSTLLPLTDVHTWHQGLHFALRRSARGQCKSSVRNNGQP